MKIMWYMIPEIRITTDRIFSHFEPSFALLHPLPLPNNPENQNFEKTPGDFIILLKCTINDYHMIYGSWDMKCTRQNVFVILGHFLTFYPSNSPKNENSKKIKKTSGDIILHKYTKNHMLYCSCDMVCDGCNCYFSFWAISCPFTLLTAQKMRILK